MDGDGKGDGPAQMTLEGVEEEAELSSGDDSDAEAGTGRKLLELEIRREVRREKLKEKRDVRDRHIGERDTNKRDHRAKKRQRTEGSEVVAGSTPAASSATPSESSTTTSGPSVANPERTMMESASPQDLASESATMVAIENK